MRILQNKKIKIFNLNDKVFLNQIKASSEFTYLLILATLKKSFNTKVINTIFSKYLASTELQIQNKVEKLLLNNSNPWLLPKNKKNNSISIYVKCLNFSTNPISEEFLDG